MLLLGRCRYKPIAVQDPKKPGALYPRGGEKQYQADGGTYAVTMVMRAATR